MNKHVEGRRGGSLGKQRQRRGSLFSWGRSPPRGGLHTPAGCNVLTSAESAISSGGNELYLENPGIHSSMHSFIHQDHTEQLLCTHCCAGDNGGEQNGS